MNEAFRNVCEFGRKLADLTQEKAAERLNCSVRMLSNYEHGIGMNSTIAAKMAEAYNFPLLAIWYMKYHDPCGKYLPDVVEPQTDMDMGFLIHLSFDCVRKALDQVTKLLQDGRVTDDKLGDVRALANELKVTAGRCMSAEMYLNFKYPPDGTWN